MSTDPAAAARSAPTRRRSRSSTSTPPRWSRSRCPASGRLREVTEIAKKQIKEDLEARHRRRRGGAGRRADAGRERDGRPRPKLRGPRPVGRRRAAGAGAAEPRTARREGRRGATARRCCASLGRVAGRADFEDIIVATQRHSGDTASALKDVGRRSTDGIEEPRGLVAARRRLGGSLVVQKQSGGNTVASPTR